MDNNHRKRSAYAERLLEKVINGSNSNNWNDAVLEWDITGWDEDISQKTSCLCGKEHLRYLFTITNLENGNQLDPIGSQCIKKFGRSDLNETTSIFEDLFKLQEAIEKRKYIDLSSNYFTRKLLEHFYNENVYDYNTYSFLKKMFNKRIKENITDKQQGKIKYHIVAEIIPYLKSTL